MAQKLGAEAFLYLNPEPYSAEFAQCATCRDWVTGDDRCFIHGPSVKVLGSMSCGLYVWGAPLQPGAKTVGIVTPTESGLVDRDVRCENCIYGGPNVYTCKFFVMLNTTLPEYFDIDTNIDPKGCCNAQTER